MGPKMELDKINILATTLAADAYNEISVLGRLYQLVLSLYAQGDIGLGTSSILCPAISEAILRELSSRSRYVEVDPRGISQ